MNKFGRAGRLGVNYQLTVYIKFS